MTTIDSPRPDDVIAKFAHLSPYRAADATELTNRDNPFRRPVRPDDLTMLGYDTAIGPDDASSLKVLIGHRILLNAYECDARYDRHDTASAVADHAALNNTAARTLADQARDALCPVLLDPIPSADADPRAVEHATTQLISSELDDPTYAFTYLLIQESCIAPIWKAVLARMAGADSITDLQSAPAVAACLTTQAVRREAWFNTVLSRWSLHTDARAYWQFYQPATLAIATHLYSLATDDSPATHDELQAHLVWQHHRDRALADISAALGRTVPAPPVLSDDPPDQNHTTAHQLRRNHAEELTRQLRWADNLDLYITAAAKLQSIIDDSGMDIDLDTFVETDAETSTTHVHDDHRLVVVESGHMQFWNNTGRTIEMSAGDKLLIPKGRLHGSVVRSGSCTYHQPIIPDDMLDDIAIPHDQIRPAPLWGSIEVAS